MRGFNQSKFGLARKSLEIAKDFCSTMFVAGLGLCVSNNAYSQQVFNSITAIGNANAPVVTLPTQHIHGYRRIDPISSARKSPVGLPGPVPELGDEAMSYVEVQIPTVWNDAQRRVVACLCLRQFGFTLLERHRN